MKKIQDYNKIINNFIVFLSTIQNFKITLLYNKKKSIKN